MAMGILTEDARLVSRTRLRVLARRPVRPTRLTDARVPEPRRRDPRGAGSESVRPLRPRIIGMVDDCEGHRAEV